MTQYISKSALIAEIERKIQNIDYEGLSDRNIGQKQSLYHILSFINTLEVKEVDLEKEIDIWYDKFATNNKFDWNGFAKHFFELGIKAKGE